jgi:regulator of protease activity HflC (stomatin/prohibitin superfamily)
MFERFFAFLAEFGKDLLPLVVVRCYQNTGVLRFGKYHRTLLPGVHWKLPFADEPYPENIFITTVRLQPQTLTTKDGHSIVVSGVVRYRVVDVQPYLSKIGDQHDLLIDTSSGAVLRAVRARTFDELLNDPPDNKIASDIRRQVKDFGVEIEGFTFVDMGRIRSIRLLTHTPTILDN